MAAAGAGAGAAAEPGTVEVPLLIDDAATTLWLTKADSWTLTTAVATLTSMPEHAITLFVHRAGCTAREHLAFGNVDLVPLLAAGDRIMAQVTRVMQV